MTTPARGADGRFIGPGSVTGSVALNAAFLEEWPRTESARKLLERRLPPVADLAQELAPNDPRTEGEQDLATSIRWRVDETDEGYVGRVYALNFKGGWYEFGTTRQGARPYLRPAAEAKGLKFRSGK